MVHGIPLDFLSKGQKKSQIASTAKAKKKIPTKELTKKKNEMKIPKEKTVYLYTWPYLDSNSNWLKTKQAVWLKAFTN